MATQRKMIGTEALGNGNPHFGRHDMNNFCTQRGCKSPSELRASPSGKYYSYELQERVTR